MEGLLKFKETSMFNIISEQLEMLLQKFKWKHNRYYRKWLTTKWNQAQLCF